jgi:hypothetical protein
MGYWVSGVGFPIEEANTRILIVGFVVGMEFGILGIYHKKLFNLGKICTCFRGLIAAGDRVEKVGAGKLNRN